MADLYFFGHLSPQACMHSRDTATDPSQTRCNLVKLQDEIVAVCPLDIPQPPGLPETFKWSPGLGQEIVQRATRAVQDEARRFGSVCCGNLDDCFARSHHQNMIAYFYLARPAVCTHVENFGQVAVRHLATRMGERACAALGAFPGRWSRQDPAQDKDMPGGRGRKRGGRDLRPLIARHFRPRRPADSICFCLCLCGFYLPTAKTAKIPTHIYTRTFVGSAYAYGA